MDVSGLSDWLGIKTNSGIQALANREWCHNPRAASWRFACIKEALKSQKPEFLKTQFSELAELEKELAPLIKPTSELEHETYSELLFLSDWSKPLNFIPFMLTIWSILRVYIMPGLSFMLPFLIVIVPYLLIKYLLHLPMDKKTYWDILYKILKGQMPIGKNSEGLTSITPDQNPKDLFKFLGQIAWVGTTLFQSLAQPYWNYKHLSKVDEIITKKGKLIGQLNTLYNQVSSKLNQIGIKIYKNPLGSFNPDARTSLAFVLTDPVPARHCLRLLGQIEVLLALASRPDICPVRWSNSDSTILKLKGCYDFNVSKNKKPFNLDLSDKKHVLLTGPNRGGKSTVLRAVSSSIGLAHTYGCAFGSDCEMSVLTNVFTCLKPDDLPGTKSRFEREVEFTSGTLRPRGPAIVLIDELYHSTNPADAKEACKVYLKQLWDQPNTISIISTHIFDIVEESDENKVLRLCCPANDLGNGRVEFLYGLEPGICKVSSVHELLVAAGMRLITS
jgi:hypothetical protein